jgi:peptidyl-prolyl cis-trans isomerase C
MNRLFLLLFLPLVAGCNLDLKLDRTDGPVLARFGADKITEKDFLEKVRSLPRSLQNIAMQRKKDFIDDMAAERFLMKEAQRQGLDEDKDVKDLIETAQKKIVIAKLIEKEIDQKLTIEPGDIAQYYEFHKEEFMTPLLLRASHILVASEAEAVQIKAQLDAGADFEELARKSSLDGTAVRGGDLGYFQKGQFVPEFEAAAMAMDKGQTSMPVKTQFGYHVIRLTDRTDPKLRDFQSVKHVVEERLVSERRAKAFKDYVERLKGNVKVEVDEPALERLKLVTP